MEMTSETRKDEPMNHKIYRAAGLAGGITDPLTPRGNEMNVRVHFRDGNFAGILTTEHPRSSYGVPIFIPDQDFRAYMPEPAYGPADLAGDVPFCLSGPATTQEIEEIRLAGFRLEVPQRQNEV